MNTAPSYPRGYRANLSREAAAYLKEMHKTCIWHEVERSLRVHILVFLAMVAFGLLLPAYPVAVLLAALPLSLLFAREQRVLELLTHDASHRNWSRNRVLNDIVASLLATLPTMNLVSSYWRSHDFHHKEYGSSQDPDLQGLLVLGKPNLSSLTKTARWMFVYVTQYYRVVCSDPLAVVGFFAWHIVFYIMPLSLIMGPMTAVISWLVIWVLPMLTVLQVLRPIAEIEEHDYFTGDTEFATTINNQGFFHKLLFHPWNDNYHLVHHLYPGIPLANLKQAYNLLLKEDPAFRNRRVRYTILGVPICPADAVATAA